MRNLLLVLFLVLLSACADDTTFISKIEEIKHIGDTDPVLAMSMLDSIRPDVQRNSSEYIKNKLELLEVRLKDKANIVPTTDSVILSIVPYFESHGTVRDKQEAYFYAGSVYRDLQDTPRALKNMLLSLRVCEDNGDCDSIMLRNTYSNLHWLFDRVQDCKNALKNALDELRMDEALNTKTVISLMHVGVSYLNLDSVDMSLKYYNEAFDRMFRDSVDFSLQNVFYLLTNFSDLHAFEKADECYRYIRSQNTAEHYACYDGYCNALGRYFLETGQLDSACFYYQRTLDRHEDLYASYDVLRHLYQISLDKNEKDKAINYASMFIEVSDSLDLGERQEQAATINNQYQYYRNAEAEKRMMEKSESRKRWIIIISFSFVLVVLLLTTFNSYQRQRQYKVILQKTGELKDLRSLAERKDAELNDVKEVLAKKAALLMAANDELSRYDEQLRNSELKLKEKTEQNGSLMRLLNSAELEESAEDVIESIRRSSAGEHKMTHSDWKRLCCAVDSLYPLFKEKVLQTFGRLSEQQLHVCYLLCIGLTNAQIRNIMNISHPTVWRWTKRYSEVLGIAHSLRG